MFDVVLQGRLGIALIVSAMVGLVFVVTLASAVEIVDRDERAAVFVFGEFRAVLEPGINIVPPFVSQTEPIETGLRTVEVRLEDVETADGTSCSAIARVDVRLVDANAAFTEVDDYEAGVEDVTEAAVRDTIRRREAETVRDERHRLEDRIRTELGETVDGWGLVVPAVELEVTPNQVPAN